MSEQPSKYGDLIQQARKPKDQESKQTDNQQAVKPDNQIQLEREVNLCVRVPESLRRHWAAESKRQGVTMTAVIMQALEAKFGRPD